MKLQIGLVFTLLLALSGCNLKVLEELKQQSTNSGFNNSGGSNGGSTPASGPWTTYTATSGATSYRAAGSVSGVGYGFIEYLPDGYGSAPGGYFPLVIFLHGIGECGDGSVSSLTHYRNNTWNAAGVQYNIDHGKYYNAVVLTPQSPGWWNAGEVDKLVAYALDHYKVNPKRVLVTGLSMGGGGTWDYVASYTQRVAAAIPICGASSCGGGNIGNVVGQNIKLWAFHALDDGTVGYGNTVACMNKIGAAMGQVGDFQDSYNSANSADQTAHFNNATKRWVFEPELDCTDPAGNPWSPQLCATAFKTGGHGIWGRVYQHPSDLPMIWLLNQSRP